MFIKKKKNSVLSKLIFKLCRRRQGNKKRLRKDLRNSEILNICLVSKSLANYFSGGEPIGAGIDLCNILECFMTTFDFHLVTAMTAATTLKRS